MRRLILSMVALLVGFLFCSQNALAARSLTIITSDKTSLFGNEEVTLTASMSGFTDGETIYVKNAFFQDGSTNYFGYTKNGDNWIKNGDSTSSQKSIKIGEWNGSLIGKSDFLDSGFKGEGDYKLKVGFYYLTSGGNLSSVNWSTNILDIHINEPDPTPSPTPTPTPTLAPTTSSNSSASIRIIATPTLYPGKSTTFKTTTPAPTPSVLGASESSEFYALDETTPKPIEKLTEEKVMVKGDDKISKIIIAVGLILILSGGAFFVAPKIISRS